jgi:hypothetical protein
MTWIIHKQLWGYQVQEKWPLEMCEQKTVEYHCCSSPERHHPNRRSSVAVSGNGRRYSFSYGVKSPELTGINICKCSLTTAISKRRLLAWNVNILRPREEDGCPSWQHVSSIWWNGCIWQLRDTLAHVCNWWPCFRPQLISSDHSNRRVRRILCSDIQRKFSSKPSLLQIKTERLLWRLCLSVCYLASASKSLGIRSWYSIWQNFQGNFRAIPILGLLTYNKAWYTECINRFSIHINSFSDFVTIRYGRFSPKVVWHFHCQELLSLIKSDLHEDINGIFFVFYKHLLHFLKNIYEKFWK